VKQAHDIQILLESTDDDPNFAHLVCETLSQLDPRLSNQLAVAPSLRDASETERARYLGANELSWSLTEQQSVLEKMKQAGQKLSTFEPEAGFKHVKLAELRAGEKLIEAGTPSAFVYFPMGNGLRVIPLGGYQSVSVAAWIPLGTTGVIRGGTRNADVIAENVVTVLILPKEVYLRHWYVPYSPAELAAILAAEAI
jgi:hypothetical protein